MPDPIRLYEYSIELDFLMDVANKYAEEHDGELPDDLYNEIDAIQRDKGAKVLDICRYIKNLEAEHEAVSNEARRLVERAREAQSRADWLRRYIATHAAGESYKDANTVLSWRKSKAVEILDKFQVPEDYCKVVVEPSKSKIKTAMESGIFVPGARIVEHNNPQIK